MDTAPLLNVIIVARKRDVNRKYAFSEVVAYQTDPVKSLLSASHDAR